MPKCAGHAGFGGVRMGCLSDRQKRTEGPRMPRPDAEHSFLVRPTPKLLLEAAWSAEGTGTTCTEISAVQGTPSHKSFGSFGLLVAEEGSNRRPWGYEGEIIAKSEQLTPNKSKEHLVDGHFASMVYEGHIIAILNRLSEVAWARRATVRDLRIVR